MVSVDDWLLDGSIENLLEGVSAIGGNLDGLNLQLRKAEMKIRQEQLKVARRTNELSEALIESNERASKQSEENATQINAATQELARSTSWLKWATWALVLFTAVQAAIAFAGLRLKWLGVDSHSTATAVPPLLAWRERNSAIISGLGKQ